MSETSSIRRRDFIAGTTAAATGLALTPESFAAGNHSLYNLSHADFVAMTGQSFSVDGTSEQGTRQRGTLILKDVVRHETAKSDARPAHVRSEGFSLHFESQDSALATGTHDISVGVISPKSVFLHEMLDQRTPGRRHYEAVFN